MRAALLSLGFGHKQGRAECNHGKPSGHLHEHQNGKARSRLQPLVSLTAADAKDCHRQNHQGWLEFHFRMSPIPQRSAVLRLQSLAVFLEESCWGIGELFCVSNSGICTSPVCPRLFGSIMAQRTAGLPYDTIPPPAGANPRWARREDTTARIKNKSVN